MRKKRKALKAAFPFTIPVLTGYIFMGIAFGILLSSKGYGVGWALLMSTCIYAGAMQFVIVNLLVSGFNPLGAVFITLLVNARHVFYGLSMLGRFKDMGKKKPYMVFSLTDETFSLICSTKAPAGVDESLFIFFIALLDQIYWITGSVIGSMVASMVSFNTKGIDFVMTALFVVIFIDQWRASKNHIPAVIGVAGSAICLLLFGSGGFILPAMAFIIIALTVFRKSLEQENQV